MTDPSSRYAAVPRGSLTRPDGTTVAYVRRRFCPDPDTMPLLAEVAVLDGERLDNLTARTLGDPRQFWRIADANGALDPLALVERAGRIVRIPVPQP